MRITLRNLLGKISRSIPNFRGKNKLLLPLLPLLTNAQIEKECLTTIKMRDGSLMLIDLRTNNQRIAFFTGVYDPGIIQKISSILRPNSTVLDVGANIGFYSIALGRKLKEISPESKVFTFEPIKPNFDRLSYLIKLNDLYNVVYPFNIALGNTEGEIPMNLGGGGSTGNATWVRGGLEKTKQINFSAPITKLDTFVQKHNIKECDLIKVDIEGAELDFFTGGANFITKCRPIILSEFNPPLAEAGSYSFKTITELALSWNYKLYEYIRLKNCFVEINKLPTRIIDFLMVPQEKPDSVLLNLGIRQ